MSAEAVNWISVGELADAFAPDSNILGRSNALIGRSLSVQSAEGVEVRYEFLSDTRLRWTQGEDCAEEDYLATSLRPGIFFVDFVKSKIDAGASVSMVFDLSQEVATIVVGRLPDRDRANASLFAKAQKQEELTAVACQLSAACIDRPFDAAAALHRETNDLVGLRVRHRYNPKELYEHIYLNAQRYAWHCIEGAEAGLADVDRCHYRRIAEDLYLFVWREKVVPTLGVVMLDLKALKTTGKIFGYKDDSLSAFSNFPIGARSQIVNRTSLGEK
jgi:hypothetical protein